MNLSSNIFSESDVLNYKKVSCTLFWIWIGVRDKNGWLSSFAAGHRYNLLDVH